MPAVDLDPERPAAFAARRGHNPAMWYGVLLGLLLLLTLWIPLASARRTVRVEQRAEMLAGLLLDVARPMQPIDLGAPGIGRHVLARLLCAATAAGVRCDDLEFVDELAPDALTFVNTDYVVQLRWSVPADQLPPPPDLTPPIEVMAWPRQPTGPAHAAFFFPEDAECAYSRNLFAEYVGLEPDGRGHEPDGRTQPKPGLSHRSREGNFLWSYRGLDHERWLLIRRSRGADRT
jgi:hypothetical protein